MKRLYSTRTRRTVAVILGFALTAAGSAFAAWVIFSGASGTGAGQVGTSTINNAVALTADWDNLGGTKVVPGTDGGVYADLHNVATVTETVTALTAGTITATPTCNTSGLTFIPDATTLAATQVTAGSTSTKVHIGTLHAAANLDPACSGAALSIAFTGTTNP